MKINIFIYIIFNLIKLPVIYSTIKIKKKEKKKVNNNLYHTVFFFYDMLRTIYILLNY